MEIEDYNYETNSNTISKEERDAFIDRFKRACRAKRYDCATITEHS